MGPSSSHSAALFAEAVSVLEEELPWEELGPLYCEGDGKGFFGPQAVAAIGEAGLKIASALGAALEEVLAARDSGQEPNLAGISVYFGAAIAELVPALCERLVLGREVRLFNLPGREPKLINAALKRTQERMRANASLVPCLPRIEVDQNRLSQMRCNHLWITSVLSDPDSFPALHDQLYDFLARKGRVPNPAKEPTGRGNLPAERRRARTLLRSLVGRLDTPAVLTTSEEELPLLRASLEESGLALFPLGAARLSAIVGDPIRSHAVRPAKIEGARPSG